MALGDECPAIKELKAALRAAFPSVDLQTTNQKYPGTRHTSGIAMDIMLDIREPREKAIADGIIAVLKAHYSETKWSHIVYSDWKPDGSIYYYHIPGGGRVNPRNKGTFSVSGSGEVTVAWDWVEGIATREVFKTGPAGRRQMKGTSNRGGDLVAAKM
jgi:hypothetical protein